MPETPGRQVRRSGASIVVLDDRVVKRQERERARRERARTEAGAEIGEESGLFLVPRIQSYDDAGGEIVFERLRGVRPLKELLREGTAAESLVERVGRALAAIHSRRPGNQRKPGGEDEEVPIHGDFSCVNMVYSTERDELAILDWSTAHWLGIPESTCLGSPSLDLATFLMSIFYRRPLAPYAIRNPEPLAHAFLVSYGGSRTEPFDIRKLCEELPHLIKRKEASSRLERGWLRVLIYHPSLRQLLRVVERIAAGDH